MKVVFQPSSSADVKWFSRYYRKVFPEGAGKATAALRHVVELLAQNPHIGHPVPDTDIRQFPVPRTSFSLFYRIAADRIDILRLWDQRRDPATLLVPGSSEAEFEP